MVVSSKWLREGASDTRYLFVITNNLLSEPDLAQLQKEFRVILFIINGRMLNRCSSHPIFGNK